MTTSGTVIFSENRDEIITDALILANVIAENETPSSIMLTTTNRSLNAMIKHWQGTGIYIWVTTEATLFLQPGQVRYTLGPGSTDHCTEVFTQTTLAAAAATSATSITVTSTSGIAASNYIGIVLSDGTTHWTTVNGAPAGTTVTLTTGLASAAATAAVVVSYTTNIVRPLKVVSARRFNLASGIDTPLMIDGREDYFDLPLKTNPGVPNIVFYDRRGGANATGWFYIWLTEATTQNAIKFTWQRPIQDFNTAADSPDLPQEWIETMTYQLGKRLALSYGNKDRYALITPEAEAKLAEMKWNEKELEDISFYPDLRNMRR